MSGRRPTGRFFILLMLLVTVAVFLIVQAVGPGEARYAVVESGSSNDTRQVQAVIMRRENVVTMESGSTISYLATEGQAVSEGDEIAYIYSAGYSVKQLQELETIRANIRTYHLTILGTIIDTRLDILEDNVEYLALQLKSLINKKTSGNLLSLSDQLTQAMTERQTYLSQNQREDSKLTSLYESESKKQTQILSWQSVQAADRDGVVSFYMDGYENYLSPDNSANITVEALKSILQGKSVDSGSSRLTTNIYRLVETDEWYVYIISDDAAFNPVSGQTFWFQMTGFEDVAYQATVVSSNKSGSSVATLLRLTDPMGPLMNQRSGKAVISTEVTGLRVPSNAIFTENGQTGVYVYDGAGGTFIPVIVLSNTPDGALISTEYTQVLYTGCYVKVK